MRKSTGYLIIACLMALLAGFMMAACSGDDDGNGGPGSDADFASDSADTGRDPDLDVTPDEEADIEPDIVEDAQPDPREDPQEDPQEEVTPDAVEESVEEPVEDAEEEEMADYPCSFPEGPYAFRTLGDVVGPMVWPDAGIGELETLEADLWALHCDPDVHSIFIQISSTTCPNCPTRLAQIKELEDHWATHGAKWIFIVNGALSDTAAHIYIERKGIDFGWRTNDMNNSLGEGSIAYSNIYAAVPWTGVIRASDMTLVYDEPDDRYLDIEAIAVELDPDAGN